MKIQYKNKNLQLLCTDSTKATIRYGEKMAEKIHQRIDEIRSAESVEMMVQYHIGRCHSLHNDRQGQYAVDLVHPQRLVFKVIREAIQIASIEEIVDYH